MTFSAWLMMTVTWTVVGLLTIRFLWRIVATPRGGGDHPEGEPSRGSPPGS